QIRYFLATTETLNFTRAAERCNVSQPALTRAIKKLEEELGGPLFRRERNRTHLTDLGQVMREHLGRVDSTTQNAVLAASKLLNLEKAPLKVGIMCTIGPTRTIPFLSKFQRLHPGIELTIFDVTPHNMTDGLLSGDLDCALLGLPMTLHERFDTVKLYEERMVAIFPADHKFAALNTIPIKELTGQRYLDRLNCEFRNSFYELLEELQIDVRVKYRSEREDWIQNMVLEGMGICLLPEYSITVDGLHCRPLSDPKLTRNVEMVTVSGHQRSPAVQAFVSEAISYPWPIL
ncbi:MAG: LysR family transcriptional regulator, partial [Sneathiella sp.]|nr:LysR family transcriptional regulator [Sneathiella sp.]